MNQHASVPGRFSKTGARRAPRLGARAEEGIMTVETRDSKFRRPEAAAFLRSLTDEEAAKRSPSVREHDGVAAHCRREGDRVCRREVAVDAALPGLQDMRHGRRVGSGKLIGRRRRNSDARARARSASRRHRRLARRRMPPRKHAVSGLPRTEGLSPAASPKNMKRSQLCFHCRND